MMIQIVKINAIKLNPNNPRLIKDGKFKKLVKSIIEFPEMLNIRPIVVNTDNVILGGNMRYKACKEAGLKEIPIIVAENLTEAQQKEFLIKDNTSGGEWDFDMLANEWGPELLDEWGLDVWQQNTDTLSNNESYEGLDQLSKLDKFLDAELKRMFLVYENETFEKVVKWFEDKQLLFNLENNSDVLLKIIENEKV